MAELTNIENWRRSHADTLASRLTALLDREQQRLFLWLPVLFGIGIAAYFSAPSEPDLPWLATLAVLTAGLHGVAGRSTVRLATAATVVIAAGALTAKLRTEIIRAPILQRNFEAKDVIGWIERVEPRATRGQRLTIRLVHLDNLDADRRPDRVRVRTQREDGTLLPGDAIRLNAMLGPPPAPAAPGDFDFGRLAFFSALGGVGIARGTLQRVTLTEPMPFALRLQAPIEHLRQAIRKRIVAALPGETGEIATALITGERGGITEDTNQAYRNSGLFHILSISGLHMVIMAGAVFYVLRLIFASVPAIALHYPIKSWAAAGAIVGALGYLLISGGSVATVRSYVMITIMFIALILGRPALSLRNVALAALSILVVYPESLFDAGFQMSFAAVVGLIASYEWLRQRRAQRPPAAADERDGLLARATSFFIEIVGSTIIASIVVAPFGIYHFHNTQMLAMIANVFAIPICNIVVMPAALGVLVLMPFGLEAPPLWLMGQGISAMTTVARWVGAMPGAVVKLPQIPTLTFALMVGGGLWLLLWTQVWRWLGILPITIGIAVSPNLPRPDLLIGRDGLTLAVRTPAQTLSALAVRGSAFDLARWLEIDGDSRPPADVARATAFTCDAVGCIAKARGKTIAVIINAAALREDCHSADIIITRMIVPRACVDAAKDRQLLIDPADLASGGAHALYFDPAGIRIETVAAARGERPWSSRPAPRERSPSNADRLTGFTSLFERFRVPSEPTDPQP